MIRVAVVTVGDEILIGQIVDTNSAWLAKEFNLFGVAIERIISISDSRDDITNTLKNCIDTYDVTIVTGGLGPTKDDITKHVLCEMFGGVLVQHDPSLDIVKQILSRLHIKLSELNRQQSFVPDCCEVILNNNGTAPAMLFRQENHILISMPGVPFEMKEICKEYVFDIIKNNFSLNSNIHRSVTLYGIAESTLAERIEDWENALPDYLHLAYLPNPSRLRLRLSAYDITHVEDIDKEIDDQFRVLQTIVPEHYIGDESEDVEVSLSKHLRERGETISTAESCTGGTISSKIVKHDGASDIFLGGVVAYSNSLKTNILGVNAIDIDKYGAVSQQVVEQMAQGIKRLTGSTYGIATSGIAGSGGGTAEKPVGTTWIAIASPSGVISQMHTFTKLREPNIERASSQALYSLLQVVKNDFSSSK